MWKEKAKSCSICMYDTRTFKKKNRLLTVRFCSGFFFLQKDHSRPNAHVHTQAEQKPSKSRAKAEHTTLVAFYLCIVHVHLPLPTQPPLLHYTSTSFFFFFSHFLLSFSVCLLHNFIFYSIPIIPFHLPLPPPPQ